MAYSSPTPFSHSVDRLFSLSSLSGRVLSFPLPGRLFVLFLFSFALLSASCGEEDLPARELSSFKATYQNSGHQSNSAGSVGIVSIVSIESLFLTNRENPRWQTSISRTWTRTYTLSQDYFPTTIYSYSNYGVFLSSPDGTFHSGARTNRGKLEYTDDYEALMRRRLVQTYRKYYGRTPGMENYVEKRLRYTRESDRKTLPKEDFAWQYNPARDQMSYQFKNKQHNHKTAIALSLEQTPLGLSGLRLVAADLVRKAEKDNTASSNCLTLLPWFNTKPQRFRLELLAAQKTNTLFRLTHIGGESTREADPLYIVLDAQFIPLIFSNTNMLLQRSHCKSPAPQNLKEKPDEQNT